MITDLLVQIFGLGLKRGMKNIIFWSEIGSGVSRTVRHTHDSGCQSKLQDTRTAYTKRAHLFSAFFLCV